MKFKSTDFRAYDIRGIYPEDLDKGFAYNLGLAYANLFPDARTVAVAREVRNGSVELMEGLEEGLLDAGRDVVEISEIVPVSVMSFVLCHDKLDGGIMVTASHNPPQWNGFKLQLKDAYPVISETFEKLRVLFEKGEFQKADNRGTLKKIDPREEYVDYLAGKVKLRRPLKIVIDAGNGGCGDLGERIFKKLGCEAETIYGDFDNSFPHHLPDPYEEKNLADLKKRVLETGADIGFGYDGDGDRIGAIDKKGDLISGDRTLIILARDALARKKGPVACETRTSLAFIEDVERLGGQIYFTVGYHKAVLDKIIETKAVFGGETTGHIYFPLDYYLYDDAIFASLKIAEIAAGMDDFPAYVESLPHYYTSPELFIDFPDEAKKQAVDQFVGIVKNKGYKFIDVDGARIVFPDGWATVRISNTSPMIKAKFEGKTREDLVSIEREAIGLMKEAGIDLAEKHYRELGLDDK